MASGAWSPFALPQAMSLTAGRPRACCKDLPHTALVANSDGRRTAVSNARRTLIPTEAGQWFQSIPDSPEAGLAVEVGNPMTGSVSP